MSYKGNNDYLEEVPKDGYHRTAGHPHSPLQCLCVEVAGFLPVRAQAMVLPLGTYLEEVPKDRKVLTFRKYPKTGMTGQQGILIALSSACNNNKLYFANKVT